MPTSPSHDMSGHVRMRTFRIVLWTLVVVAAIGATALVLSPAQPFVRAVPAAGSSRWSISAALRSTRSLFVGKPSLLFFGYTHCPDVCPTTMGEMQGWFAALGDEAKTLQGVFVTVDPARDTPEILDDYVSLVSDRIVALTGDRRPRSTRW